MSRRALQLVVAVVAVVLVLAGVAACASSSAVRSTPSGFVGHDGRSFTVDGTPGPLVGINVYNAASRGNCWYDQRTLLPGALRSIRTASGGRANVIRVWFFQRLATQDGRRDWTEFDRVLRTARAEGFRVIPVLTDQWGACEGPGESSPYKDVTWYQDGYRRADPAGTVSYRDWTREVVARYRDDPTVALWSLVNEAEAKTGRTGTCPSSATDALAAFTADMGRVVREADPHHLLGLGTIGSGQCGTAGPAYVRLHQDPAIDVCEYHDYDLEPVPGDTTNGLAARLAACTALGKPLFVGESGADPAEVGGVAGRAQFFRDKTTAQVSSGIAGLLMWGWSQNGYGPDDEFGIGPQDPSLGVLGEYPGASSRARW